MGRFTTKHADLGRNDWTRLAGRDFRSRICVQ